MKKSSFITVAIVFLLQQTNTKLFGQTPHPGVEKKMPAGFYSGERRGAATLDCSSSILTGCNHILNNTFTYGAGYDPSNYYIFAQPFNLNLISDWVSSHGDPIVWDGVNWTVAPPPFLNAGRAWMGAHANFPNFNPPTGGEGLAQKIPPLQNGHTYALSFFRRAGSIDPNAESPLDIFDIYLIRCVDNPFNQSSYVNPVVPAISQHIYCETDVDNLAGWQRVVVTFTVNRSDYDMIWIYPREVDDGTLYEQSGLFFSFPELIDLNSFSAGPPPNPTPGNCTVTIGPNLPNCGLMDAVFTWHGPYGQNIIAPANQQIQIDAGMSQNQGSWTLTMTVPTSSTTSNNCSQQLNVSATVNVPSCYLPPTTGSWIWMEGANTVNQYGNYGIQGTSSPSNQPGARMWSSSWKDNSGNFWLYGGMGYGSTFSIGHLSDLWKYNTTTKEWTWVNGNTTANTLAVYGIQGVPSVNNNPGSRIVATTWTDASGNLWLYGGSGYAGSTTQGIFNDLWKFNTTTNEWTWVKGSNLNNQPPVRGTLGIPSSSNNPGSGSNSAGWADLSGNFWLVGGGSGYDDIFKFNPITNEWTWIKGTTTLLQAPVYGTQGVSSPSNTPGYRPNMNAKWLDNNGNLILFGGSGNNKNDIWKYNVSINQWVWLAGSSSYFFQGIYGTPGVPSASNSPGGRMYQVSWVDAAGNYWMFGGEGYSASSTGYLNDLWKLDPNTYQWTWVTGSNYVNQTPNWGVQEISNINNNPGAKSRSVSWTDVSGRLWLFGGFKQNFPDDMYNDLWKYDINCIIPNCRYSNPITQKSVKKEAKTSGTTSFASSKDKVDLSQIKQVEIINISGQVIYKSNNAFQIREILNKNSLNGIQREVYILRIINNDNSQNIIKKFF